MVKTFEILKDTLLKLIIRNGTNSERVGVVLDVGEPAYTIDGKRLYVGDGVTPGGNIVGNICWGSRPLPTENAGVPAPGDLVYSTDNKFLYYFKGGLTSSLENWVPIANGATVELNFLPLSGGSVTGNISATGNITATGNLSATGNITTDGSITAAGGIYTADNITATGNITGASIKAQNTLFANGGDSLMWNSSYSTVTNLSSLWNHGYTAATTISSLSSNWNTTYTTITSNIDGWNDAITITRNLSTGILTTVNTLSSGWSNAYTVANTLSVACLLSGSWETSYKTLCSLSALWGTEGQETWDTTYSSVCSLSPIWGTAGQESYTTYNTLCALSGGWETTYTTISSLSDRWVQTYDGVAALSANWSSAYVVITGLSDKWQESFLTTNNLSGSWNTAYTYVNRLTGTSFLTTLTALSSRWQTSYTTVNSKSATWDGVVYDTSRWDTAYNTISSLSGKLISAFNSVSALSASWSSNQIIRTDSSASVFIYATDAYKYIRLTQVGAVAITIPSVAFPVGAEVTFRKTPSVGNITLLAPSTVVINDKDLISTVLPGRNFKLKYLGSFGSLYNWDLIV